VIVVDASAVLELLLNSTTGQRVAERLFAPDESLHSPSLIDLEVCQVLRRYRRSGEFSDARARQALDDFLDLPLHRYASTEFVRRIWQLRNTLTACDAAYVALAEALDAPLLTCDRRLHRAPGHAAAVVLP
jgi:predicted nucleic acid-binding protein